MFGMVAEFLGDGVLMYASDYPHSECRFPNSVDNIPAGTRLDRDTREKLLSGSATRFCRQS